MSFISKNLNHPSKSGMTFFKGATLFFLGMSAVMFLTQAFEIVPSVKNVRQYIQEIIFTTDGYSTSDETVTIDGASGNAYFAGNLGIGVSDPDAKFDIQGTNGIDTLSVKGDSSSDRLLIISGDPNNRDESIKLGDVDGVGSSQLFSISSGKFIFSSGNVGIGTDTPGYALDVAGTGSFDEVCIAGECMTTRPTGGTVISGDYLLLANSGDYYTSNPLGYITGYTETDPIFLAQSGDYYTTNPLGYITGYTETDPIFLAVSGDYLLLANSGDYYTSNPLGYITGYTETDPIWMADSGSYYPLIGNSIANPVTGDFYMDNGTGNYTIEIGTTNMIVGTAVDVVGPVVSPISYVPGMGPFPIMVTKGWNLFMGESGQDTQVFVSNSDTNFATALRQKHDKAEFSIDIHSGGLMGYIGGFTFFADGRIRANPDPASVISDDKDFITKGYADATYLSLADSGTYYTNNPLGYITGGQVTANEIDPVWSAASGDYLPLSGNTEGTPIFGNVYMNDLSTLYRGDTNTFIQGNTSPPEIYLVAKQGFGPFPNGGIDIFHNEISFHLEDSDGIPHRVSLGQTGALKYDDDYSAEFTDRSLIDKGYADAHYSGVLAGHRDYTGGVLTPVYTGDIKFQVGYNSSAIGDNSIAIGYEVQAIGDNSTAMGIYTEATKYASTAIGYNTNANGNISTAMGMETTASGVNSTAMGYQTIAGGSESTAMGDKTQAIGNNSTAMGNQTQANGINSVAMGMFNLGLGNSIFEVGIGTSGTPKNALTISNTGIITLDQLTGYACLGTDSNGMIIEVDCTLSGGSVGGDYLLIANSGDYYTTNPLGYITGGQVPANETDPVRTAASGDYANINIYTGLTLGYVPYRNGSIFTNSYLFATGGMIGLGITTPEYALDVSGAIQSNDAFYLTGGTIPRKITLSGDNLSFQAFTGGSRVEKHSIAP